MVDEVTHSHFPTLIAPWPSESKARAPPLSAKLTLLLATTFDNEENQGKNHAQRL